MMITLENFGPDNRERRIGNSLYRICLDDKTKEWYITEYYHSVMSSSTGRGFYSYDLGKVIAALNGFIKECEIVKPGPWAEAEAPEAAKLQELEAIGKGAGSSGKPAKPMTVSPELFKQMVFDIVMESQDQMSAEATDALLDLINRFDIGSPWRTIEKDGKPASGEYFFIKLKESAGYTDPYWREPMMAKRMKGGFHVAGRPFPDSEVEAYSEVRMPR
ncbi:MAG: hypothetical protein NC489_30690 [Ruminococcus flavefaciens]|nr:hypothetical protein [Ruminococcus flavefaciens]